MTGLLPIPTFMGEVRCNAGNEITPVNRAMAAEGTP
jgi:hypothetical protein